MSANENRVVPEKTRLALPSMSHNSILFSMPGKDFNAVFQKYSHIILHLCAFCSTQSNTFFWLLAEATVTGTFAKMPHLLWLMHLSHKIL